MTSKNFLLAGPLLLLLFLSGCAPKQWQDPLGEEEYKATRTLVLQEQAKRAESCSCCLDAEATVTWDSKFSDGGLNGYLQVFLPSSFKLVAINPLGQPLFALTTDGETFQTINAVKGIYKHGKVSSFVSKHDVPPNVFHGEWGHWLTGDMGLTEENLTKIRQDATGRGVWLAVDKQDNKHFSKEFLLYDVLQRRLLERVVFDTKGNEAARIVYRTWTETDTCPLPSVIDVLGVSFDTTIRVELKDILTDRIFSSDNFSLRLPPGYLQQYYP